ncbi:hypothetical protein P8452_13914 [Trifolium repens]|nr:hypothetical protein P8452_13914 [Trifolium repens]
MCRPILPMPPHLDALSPMPLRAGVEKIKVFRIAPGRVMPPPCIVGGTCAQGERENSICRPILSTPTHLDPLSLMPLRAGVEKIKVFRIAPGGVTPLPCIVGGTCAQGERGNSICRPILSTPTHLDPLSPVPWRAGFEIIKVFRITPEGVTTPPYIVVGACAQGEYENSMCRPILPMPPHLDALSPMPLRAGVEKIKVFRIAPGGVMPPPCIVGGTCAQGERENSICRPILSTPTHLDPLSPVPWRAGFEIIKLFRITPEGVTTPPYIVVGACAKGEHENSMCRPILPTSPHLDALNFVPWRAGVEKVKVFRITPEGVRTPPYIVVGVCAQGERENSMCRPILPMPPHMDALSPMPLRVGSKKSKCFELHLEVSHHLLVSWEERVHKENMKIPCVGQFRQRHRIWTC